MHHAGAERRRRDQPQRDRGVRLVEQAQTVTQGDRVHQQVQLVEHAGNEQLPNDRDRATDRDVGVARLLLEGRDCGDEVATQLLGVAPRERSSLVGHDDLAGVAQLLGELRVVTPRHLAVRPRLGERVVGLAAEQQRVGGAELGVDGGAHLVVEVREVPFVGVLDDTVDGDEQPGGDLPHGALLRDVPPAPCQPDISSTNGDHQNRQVARRTWSRITDRDGHPVDRAAWSSSTSS